MFKIITFILICLSISLTPSSIFARDPFPNKARIKHIVAPMLIENPYSGQNTTDPETMLQIDIQSGETVRSDAISFNCLWDNDPTPTYLKDIDIDTQLEANYECQQIDSVHLVGGAARAPFLKGNVMGTGCPPSINNYKIECYSWPMGNFIGRHIKALKGGWSWVTPVVYHPGANSQCPGGTCTCSYVPEGGDYVQLERTVDSIRETCTAPRYSSSSLWWTNYYLSTMNNIQASINVNQLTAVQFYLGFDGEDRPLKSGEGWGLVSGNNYDWLGYRNAVIQEVKRRYPTKTIRGHCDNDSYRIADYLENDIDFHRESLASDETDAYLYRGLNPFGWWQGPANYFWTTNTLGIGQVPHPMYQTMMGALSKHTDGVTGYPLWAGLYDNGKGDFIKFIDDYMGKDINDTPGVWINLRDTKNKKDRTQYADTSGKYGDFDYYLYRPENLADNHTEAVNMSDLPAGAKNQIYSFDHDPNGNAIGQYVARKNTLNNHYMSFDIDDGYRFTGRSNASFDVRIVFLDSITIGTANPVFEYKNSSNVLKQVTILKSTTPTEKWKEFKFTITDAYFNNNFNNPISEGSNDNKYYPTDFRIKTNGNIFHLIELRGTNNSQPNPYARESAQVSCDLIKQKNDNPLEGIYSVHLNDEIYVKATLKKNNGDLISNERIMFTYNTEWNYAPSEYTDSEGNASAKLKLENNINSSGFLWGRGGTYHLPSWYSVQVYYPGSSQYKPSRNDCLLAVNNPDSNNSHEARIKITNTPYVDGYGKLIISYQVLNRSNTILKTVTNQAFGKGQTFYDTDGNAQTIPITWNEGTTDYYPTTIHYTYKGTHPTPSPTQGPTNTPTPTLSPTPTSTPTTTPTSTPGPFTPPLNLQAGVNSINVSSINNTVLLPRDLPSECTKVSVQKNYFFQPLIPSYSRNTQFIKDTNYSIYCKQNDINW